MTQKITLGNADQGIAGPASPTNASQLFTSHGNWKFTITFGNEPVDVLNDMPFHEFMVLSQTQNNKNVVFGAADGGGNFTDVRRAQASMIIYRDATEGQADLVEAPRLRFQGPAGSAATFLYGKDN